MPGEEHRRARVGELGRLVAAAVADLVTSDASHEWACEVLEQIALRLNDDELAAEARSLAEQARKRDDEGADEGDAA